uniref:Inner membrane protein YgaP-like transmembrane domain-containing protein n=1 Tax=Caulobacter sp. (strain K31) TaxID=366602 RepID=B0SWH8_CAUSK
MSIDRMVLAFAGFVVLVGVALAHFVHPWWIGLSIFAGLNMIQAAFTGFCPAAMIFKKLGVKPGVAFR